MAEYTVRANAIDSYTEDMNNGQAARGTVLTASESGYYHYVNGDSGTIGATVQIIFPATTPAGYEKKRLKRAVYSYFITTRQGSASGALPSGAKFCFGVSDRRMGFQPGIEGVGNFDGVPQNGYMKLAYNTQQLAPKKGFSAFAGCTDAFTNVTYRYSVSASMQSHTGANVPYAEYTFEDVVPFVTGAYPTSGFVNEKESVALSWRMGYSAAGVQQQLTTQNAKFRYRNAGVSGYTELDYLRDGTSAWNGSSTHLIIPANSGRLPLSGDWEWQVLVQSNDGLWSDPSPWYTLTTTDSTCYAEAIRPKDAYVDGSVNVQLVWLRTISTGTSPSGSDYQVSTDNGTGWQDIGHAPGYEDLTAIPGTLPAGSILWRVRGYNTDGVAGPWSAPAAIVVRASPPLPSISSITVEARPTVTWQATGQQAYQVRVRDIYDSGAVYGADKFHKVKVWLANGPIIIGVRVQNSFGMWSPWAEVSAAIANRPGPEIRLSATTRNNGVSLRWQTSGAYQQYYIYRDGTEIALKASAEYIDYLCNGKHRYQVRGITVDGQYTMSNEVVEILTPAYAYISLAEEWDWLTLPARRGARPAQGADIKPNISYIHYSGRQLPVAEISEFEDRTHSFDFTFGRSSPPDSADRLAAMVGQLVVYKDSRGGFAMGIMENLSINRDVAADVSFSIVEVDTT